VRIAVAATPAVAIPTLDALLLSGHDLTSVITKADAPAGRGRELQASPVSHWGDANKVKVFKPATKEALGNLVSDLVSELDLVITIGYGLIIPSHILTLPKYGFINLHFSLLPRWRGAAPVQRAIEAGDSVTGVTVFQLDAGMDTGPIYQSAQITLSPADSSERIFQSLANLGVEPVLETLRQIQSGVQPVAQIENGATRANKLSKEEGHLDWSSDAIVIVRKVNAFNPSPGTWSLFRGEVLKINQVRPGKKSLPIGSLEYEDGALHIGTATSALEILEVTPAGKAAMSAKSWANGARLEATDLLK
jgi:methionyl-tRNA formyltransferase